MSKVLVLVALMVGGVAAIAALPFEADVIVLIAVAILIYLAFGALTRKKPIAE